MSSWLFGGSTAVAGSPVSQTSIGVEADRYHLQVRSPGRTGIFTVVFRVGEHCAPAREQLKSVLMTNLAQFPDEQSDDGEFQRQEDAFRDLVGQDPYPAE